MLGPSFDHLFALRNIPIHLFILYFHSIHSILMNIWCLNRYLTLNCQILKFLLKFDFKCNFGCFRNSRNHFMVDMDAGHLSTNGIHECKAWELGPSHLCLVTTERALLCLFGASQSWLVIQKSHLNRVVLVFQDISHISWDKGVGFDLDRCMGVDMFVRVLLAQLVSWTPYLRATLWWLNTIDLWYFYAVIFLVWRHNLETCATLILLINTWVFDWYKASDITF